MINSFKFINHKPQTAVDLSADFYKQPIEDDGKMGMIIPQRLSFFCSNAV